MVSTVAPGPELQAEAQALADDMLRASPLGLRLTKDALGHAVDAAGLDAVVALEDRNQILCSQTDDFQEGIAAFLGRRAPRYSER